MIWWEWGAFPLIGDHGVDAHGGRENARKPSYVRRPLHAVGRSGPDGEMVVTSSTVAAQRACPLPCHLALLGSRRSES